MRFNEPSGSWLRGPNRGTTSRALGAAGPSAGRLADADWALAALVGLLVALGMVFLYSASSTLALDRFGSSTVYLVRQLRALGVGLLVGGVLFVVPPHWYARMAKRAVAASVVLLLAVYLPGVGSPAGRFHRWINIAGVPFQPVELAKLAVILYAAQFLGNARKDVRSFSRGVLPHVVIMAVFVGLLLLQPDFGSAVLLCAVVFGMLIAGGARLSHLALLGTLGAISGYLLIASDPYRRDRLLTFTRWIEGTHAQPDDAGYQIWQAYDALSTGGWGGVGMGRSLHKLFYLPAPHTDFIFAVIGEELGFLGASAVVILLMLVLLRGFRLALRLEDPFMKLAAFGICLSLGLQAAINLAMTVGLLPTKGIPLPLISYGGSSLVMTLAMVGMLLNFSRFAGRPPGR